MAPIIGLTEPLALPPGYRLQKHRAGIWITRAGDEVPVAKMTNGHLQATMCLLRRWSVQRILETQRFYLSAPTPNGDMAQDAYWEEFGYWCGTDESVLLADNLACMPIWRHMVAEAQRRRLPVPEVEVEYCRYHEADPEIDPDDWAAGPSYWQD